VGAGHAGSEAAAAAANLGSKTLLVTMSLQKTLRRCLVILLWEELPRTDREIDALGGYSGIVSDNTQSNLRC
jgi:tRNA uridine 5-carboxymethylaminomethyl modification enzyme